MNYMFYLGQYGNFNPYLGLNGGVMAVETRIEMGLYAVQETKWHWALGPEAGFMFPSDRFLGYVSARYNYAFEAGDAPEVAYWSFQVGLGLR